MKKVIVIDTSIFCVWLRIRGFESCGPDRDSWDYDRIDAWIENEIENYSTLVLPLATIIETGNHLSQSKGDRYQTALTFCDVILKTVDSTHPWAAFSEQGQLWDDNALRELVNNWPELAAAKVSIGDATIKRVAEFYANAGFKVEILTGDKGLKAYQPAVNAKIPRRRQ